MDDDLIHFAQKSVQTKSYSDHEGEMIKLAMSEMMTLNYNVISLDTTGNIIGQIGNGKKIIQFDSHLDTVKADDPKKWQQPPFSGNIIDGWLWGRGSVDMKSSFCASVYGAALARDKGWLDGKTVYVTGTVCEEYCDGVNLKHLYEFFKIKPDYCIICEPSDNNITLGHKGKFQARITTHGISAHGSAPEKGKNAVYEMAEIIQRVEELNHSLMQKPSPHGSIVLSDISCESASLNAVPSSCSIYIDRRLAPGEKIDDVKGELNSLIHDKAASWETGTLKHKSWSGKTLIYEPVHEAWKIDVDNYLTRALIRAYKQVYKHDPEKFDFWDFGTNAVTPVSMGIPTIGFGCGEYKLAHMIDERIEVRKILEAEQVYANLIREL